MIKNGQNKDTCDTTCHHPLRIWVVKYRVIGVPKYIGVGIIQARDLKSAEYTFIQNSRFNGFREKIKIVCIDEIMPSPENCLLEEDTVAVLDKAVLGTYPFLLKSEYYDKIDEVFESIHQEAMSINLQGGMTAQETTDFILQELSKYIEGRWITKGTIDNTDSQLTDIEKLQNDVINPEAGWVYIVKSNSKNVKYVYTIEDGWVNIGEVNYELTQPDWNQNDITAADFIKNKPTITYENEILIFN